MAAPSPPEDLLDAIQALKDKEASAYRVLDYLYGPPHDDRISVGVTAASAFESAITAASSADFSLAYSVGTSGSTATATDSSKTTEGVNEDWRSKICEWSYQVIDHFDYDREIVAVSLSYLDRYLGKRAVDKRTFQLVAMTTLSLAAKLYSPRHQQFSVHTFRKLSRGYFDEEHIAAMEQSLLCTLGWYLHPPTPFTFAKHLVLLLDPNACSTPQAWHDMMDVAKFLTELAVIDYHFALIKPSSVGLAALLTAMEGVSEEHLPMTAKEEFACNVCHLAHIDPTDHEVMDCRTRLRDMYRQNDPFEKAASVITSTPSRPTTPKDKVERIKADSPTGVDGVNFASVSLSGSSSDAMAAFDEKGTKRNAETTKETVASSPAKAALLAKTANATLNTTTTSTSNKSKPSAKTRTSSRSSIASNVKKLRKAIRSSQQVEDAKKRRMD